LPARAPLKQLFGRRDRFVERPDGAVHLEFVDRLQDLSDARPPREAELEEMTAEENRTGRLVFHAQLTRTFEKPVHRRTVERAGLSPEAVGFGEPREQFEVHFRGEPTKSAIADLVLALVPRARLQVLRREP